MPGTMFRFRSRSPFHVAVACILIAAAACGKDSSSTGPGAPSTPGTSATTGISIATDSASALQTAAVGTIVHVSVHLKNADGTPSANQTVNWTVELGGGTVAAATTTTNAQGAATVDWTLGKTAGSNTLTASIVGASSQMLATGTAGPLTALIKVSKDSQSVVSNASVALVVQAGDQFGNPVAGVAISWTTTGGTFIPSSTTSGASGNATITFTAGGKPATYTITASTPGLPPVSFTVNGV
jgi:hypothetical protein